MPIQLVANYITVTDPNEFPGNTPAVPEAYYNSGHLQLVFNDTETAWSIM